MRNILLAGGGSHLGLHTLVMLAETGHDAVVYDNLSNRKVSVSDCLTTITNHRLLFVEDGVPDEAQLEEPLRPYGIDAVIHFSGLKAGTVPVETPNS
jgi:UDP-glucose 4-epimerase